MSVLDKAIAHAKSVRDVEVKVPEWDVTLYYRGHLSAGDFSIAVRALNACEIEPICKLLVKYAQLEDGSRAFPEIDDAFKLKSAVDPGVILRAFTPAIRPPDSVEVAAKN